MRTVPRLLLAIVVLTVLAWATPALAQPFVLQPGDYTLDWVVRYRSGFDGSFAFQAGINQISLLRTDGLDASSPYRGLCSTPYVTLGPPHTPEFGGTAIWCLNADGTLGDTNSGSTADAGPSTAPRSRSSTSLRAITGAPRVTTSWPLPGSCRRHRRPTTPLKVFITQPKAPATVRGTVWVVLWVEGTSGASNVFTLSADGKQVGTRRRRRGPRCRSRG